MGLQVRRCGDGFGEQHDVISGQWRLGDKLRSEGAVCLCTLVLDAYIVKLGNSISASLGFLVVCFCLIASIVIFDFTLSIIISFSR